LRRSRYLELVARYRIAILASQRHIHVSNGPVVYSCVVALNALVSLARMRLSC
jgi:hypothetical protein